MSEERYFELITGEDHKGNSYYLIPFDFINFKVNPYYYSSPLKEDPFLYQFDEFYNAKIEETKLSADFYLLSNLASDTFLNLLNKFNISFRSIPLNIELDKKNKPEKNYYLIYITDIVSILDESLSDFKLMEDKYTNEIIIENGLKKYDEITKFIIDKQKVYGHHLFYCTELAKIVCSSTFKESFLEHSLVGIDFKEINDEYKYYCINPALFG